MLQAMLQALRRIAARELRALARGRLSAAVGIGSLAIGLAVWASAAVLVYERSAPPPYTDPAGLTLVAARDPVGQCRQCVDHVPRETLSVWAASGTFERTAAYATQSLLLGDTTAPVRVSGALVDGDFFRVLGTVPRLGRVLEPQDQRGAADGGVVISYELWQRHFDGSPRVLGRPLRLDGRSYVVAGVMPARFDFPQRTQVWLPIDAPGPGALPPAQTVMGIARLHPAVTADVAERRLGEERVRATVAQVAVGASDRHDVPRVLPLLDRLRVSASHTSRIVGGALFVLVIACLNFGLLGAYHAGNRDREWAIRSALGAPPGAASRDMLLEIGVHALGAAAGGMLLTFWATHLLAASLAINTSTALGWRIAAVVTGTALLGAGGVAALRLPAARRASHRRSLQGDATTSSASPRARRLRNAFVGVQAAFTLAASVLAICLLLSYRALHRVDLGVDALRVLVTNVVPPTGPSPRGAPGVTPDRVSIAAVLDRAARVPGVAQSAAWRTWVLPQDRRSDRPSLETDMRIDPRQRRLVRTVMDVSPGFFGAVGIRVTRGRTFSPDAADDSHTVVVNERAASLLWPGERAVGRRLRLVDAEGTEAWFTVIGVVSDARAFESVALLKAMLAPDRPTALLYRSLTLGSPGTVSIGVRQRDGTTVNPLALWTAVRLAAPEAMVEVPVPLFEAMSSRVADVPWTRAGARLMLGLAVVAMFLVVGALYAVVCDEIRRRADDLAIRRALGANAVAVAGVVLRPVVTAVLAGLSVGGLGLVLARGPLRALLFGISAADPLVLGAVSLVVLACSALACLHPLRQTLAADPAVTLRSK
jgi:putative ABC transport system permease protein